MWNFTPGANDAYGGQSAGTRRLADQWLFDAKPPVQEQPATMTPAAPLANNPNRVANVSYPGSTPPVASQSPKMAPPVRNLPQPAPQTAGVPAPPVAPKTALPTISGAPAPNLGKSANLYPALMDSATENLINQMRKQYMAAGLLPDGIEHSAYASLTDQNPEQPATPQQVHTEQSRRTDTTRR
jgi:hypothetical protein